LEIIDGYVHINGKKLQLSDRANVMYNHVVVSDKGVSSRLLNEVGATDFSRKYIPANLNQQQANVLRANGYAVGSDVNGKLAIFSRDEKGIQPELTRQLRLSLKEETPKRKIANLTSEMAAELRKNPNIQSVELSLKEKGKAGTNIFPQDSRYPWNNDNLGPIYLPEKGKTVKISPETLPLYKKIIRDYEGNTVSVSGNQVSINGTVTDTYTFKQGYYWMMGDNRHHSEDSRTWGYVPADHIVGKPVFIWMSLDNFPDGIRFNEKIRWDRVFTTVGGSGKPVSYFAYFLIALAGWFVFDFFRKRKKAGAADS